MTNVEFQKRFEVLCEKHPFIGKRIRKTFNELVWLLRRDDVDYNICIPPYKADMGWLCICSVKECFIPVNELAMHVKEIILEEDFECNEICLTVCLEE